MAVITVANLEQKLEDLQQEHDELLERAASLEEKMTAFRLVIDEYSADTEKPAISLSSMSLADALVALAEHHGGELSTYQVRPVLLDAGLLIGEPRAVSLQLYHTLTNSGRFESAGPRGRYRLVPPSPEDRAIVDEELGLT